jgi:AcrR family transcriptional regulator
VTLLWVQHGVIGDSVRVVANLAGVGPATIYRLVGNRDETLTEIMSAQLIQLTKRVGAAADAMAEAPVAEKLEALLVAYLTGVAAEPHAHFLLQHALVAVVPRGREVVRSRYRVLLELLGEPLVPLAPSVDGRLAVALALAAVGAAGDALMWFDPKQEMEVPATARRLTAMLRAAVGSAEGLGPRPGCGGPIQACARAWLAGGCGGGKGAWLGRLARWGCWPQE